MGPDLKGIGTGGTTLILMPSVLDDHLNLVLISETDCSLNVGRTGDSHGIRRNTTLITDIDCLRGPWEKRLQPA